MDNDEFTKRDERVVFAFASGSDQADRIPVLVFMVSDAAWKKARDGKSHEFDLTKLGLPMKIAIARCRSYAHGVEMLQPYLKGQKVADVRHIDVGVTPKDQENPN